MRRLTHMNETNISPRQQQIINLLQKGEDFSRLQIQKQLQPNLKISRPTLIRDLNHLLTLKVIKQSGSGKNITYSIYNRHPLLTPISLDNYFQEEPDQRKISYKKFNFDIFIQLQKIFTLREIEIFDQGATKFQQKQKELDFTTFQKELERFLIELSWKSSKIEGNTYSLLETEALIKNNTSSPKRTPQETTMILNHKKTFNFILNHKKGFKKLSLHNTREIHQQLTQNLAITPNFRTHAVGITGTIYQPPDNHHQITSAMEQVIKIVNSTPHPALKSFLVLILIAYIQPFADGNKRTSRLVSNAILLAYGYHPISYRSIDEVEYKQALILFFEQNNLYHFKRLYLNQYQSAVQSYFN